MGKNWLLGIKKDAVLALFYCGLQSVKSFHIPLLTAGTAKVRRIFEFAKFLTLFLAGGSAGGLYIKMDVLDA